MMKKLLVAALATSAALASPVMAQTVSGTVTLNGSVAPKCFVVPGSGSTFTDTVNFGELAQADGTVRTDLATAFGTRSFTVLCNSGTPKVAVDAQPLATAAPASTGYDNSIDFTASVAVLATGTNNGPFTNDSAAAAGTATAVGSSLSNVSNNVLITTANYRTNNATDLLVANPTYTGSILVTITPN